MNAILKNQTLIPGAIIVAGLITVFFLSNYLNKIKLVSPIEYVDEDLAVQAGKLKGFSFGMEGLIADWYWVRSLQYIGDKVIASNKDIDLENLRTLNPRLLYPYLNTATDLDPHFMAVYSYGAVVLPAIDPAEAIKIAEKGIANNPSEWRLYQQLGYIYWRLGNFEKASEVYDQGAMIQGAAPFMKMMSARMRSEGGSRETARAIYRQMLEESADKQLQENAALRLLELDSRDDMDAIQKALEEFKTQNGRCANSLRELRPLLVTAVLPEQRQFRVNESNELVDPTGAPYQLDSKTCNVSLDKKNTKLPIS